MNALKLKKAKPNKSPGAKSQVKLQRQIAQEVGSITEDSAELLLKTWKAEVDSLSDAQFLSFSEAVDAVIKGVLCRIDPRISEANEIEGFLRTLIETDPEIIETLYEALNIADKSEIE